MSKHVIKFNNIGIPKKNVREFVIYYNSLLTNKVNNTFINYLRKCMPFYIYNFTEGHNNICKHIIKNNFKYCIIFEDIKGYNIKNFSDSINLFYEFAQNNEVTYFKMKKNNPGSIIQWFFTKGGSLNGYIITSSFAKMLLENKENEFLGGFTF